MKPSLSFTSLLSKTSSGRSEVVVSSGALALGPLGLGSASAPQRHQLWPSEGAATVALVQVSSAGALEGGAT